MKTRIILLLIVIKALSTATAYAQDKNQFILYEKIYGGFSLFTPGSERLAGNDESFTFNLTTGSYKENRLAAGAGLSYGFGLATPLGTSWLAGIDLNYLNGTKLKYTGNSNASSAVQDVFTASNYYSILSVVPGITYKVFTRPNYFVYSRVGVILALNTATHYMDQDYQASTISSDDDEDAKYRLGLGFQTSAGVQFKLTSRISGFCELTGNFLTVTQKSVVGTDTFKSFDANGNVTQGFVNQFNESFGTSSSGVSPRKSTVTVNGVTTTSIFTDTNAPPFPEHINNIVLTVGIVAAFR